MLNGSDRKPGARWPASANLSSQSHPGIKKSPNKERFQERQLVSCPSPSSIDLWKKKHKLSTCSWTSEPEPDEKPQMWARLTATQTSDAEQHNSFRGRSYIYTRFTSFVLFKRERDWKSCVCCVCVWEGDTLNWHRPWCNPGGEAGKPQSPWTGSAWVCVWQTARQSTLVSRMWACGLSSSSFSSSSICPSSLFISAVIASVCSNRIWNTRQSVYSVHGRIMNT